MGRRVAITGAFGYLGGRIADFFAQRGDHVVLSGRSIPAGARDWASRFEVRLADVLDEGACVTAFHDVDAVLHLASLDEREAIQSPERASLVSGAGTRSVLAAARKTDVARVIFFSTFHVYGKAHGEIDETTPTEGTHPYAVAHLLGDQEVANARVQGQSAVSLRLSNGYGAPSWVGVDRWSLAHNDFCRQAYKSSVIRLATPGTQHRDFVAVDDVAAAAAVVLDQQDAALGEGVFDVGGDLSLSIHDLAIRVREVAARLLEREVAIERPQPTSSGDGPPVRFSIDRLRALGYQPVDRIDDETVRLIDLLRGA